MIKKELWMIGKFIVTAIEFTNKDLPQITVSPQFLYLT